MMEVMVNGEFSLIENVTLEIARFRLAADVVDSTLIAEADKLHHQFLKKQKGYIDRRLLKGDDGEWVDLVRYESLQDAQHTNELIPDEPSAAGFFQSIDPGSVNVQYFHILKSWDI